MFRFIFLRLHLSHHVANENTLLFRENCSEKFMSFISALESRRTTNAPIVYDLDSSRLSNPCFSITINIIFFFESVNQKRSTCFGKSLILFPAVELCWIKSARKVLDMPGFSISFLFLCSACFVFLWSSQLINFSFEAAFLFLNILKNVLGS